MKSIRLFQFFRFTVPLLLLFLGSPVAALESNSAVVVVVVEGTGETIDAAKAAAIREAVENVVGALLKTVTTAENDEIIEDKIKSCSSAYVEKSEQMGVTQDDDGQYTVKIKASVRRTQLIGDLEKYVCEIKGAELLEKIRQIQSNQKAFEDFFKEEFNEAVGAIVVAQPMAEAGCLPFLVDEDGNVSMDVRVGIDPDAYRVFSRGLVEKLRPFAMEVELLVSRKISLDL